MAITDILFWFVVPYASQLCCRRLGEIWHIDRQCLRYLRPTSKEPTT